jgi:hypothetical protein
MAISERSVRDHCRNSKDAYYHRDHYINLPNDPNAKDRQLLAPSCSSEKEHSDGNREQNNSAREIHGLPPVNWHHNIRTPPP